MEKPKNIEGFKRWYGDKFKKIDQSTINYYDSVTNKMKLQIENSDFWNGILLEIKEMSDEYLLKTKYEFVSNSIEVPKLLIKPFESYIDKIYRKNVVNNDNWPEAPDGDWYLIDKSFNRINDIIRSSFVVKYLDGVELLANRLAAHGKETGNNVVTTLEAREHGYYAAHLDISFQLDIPMINWETETLPCSIELQLTTQLQEVLKKLTHTYYETTRTSLEENNGDKKWQWNYRSEEFTANYLGHILHYLEGMILETRDRRQENGKV